MGSFGAYMATKADEWQAEAERLKKENASLREQLRLANDKMAEQVRQARHAMAEDILLVHASSAEQYMGRVITLTSNIRDANAPKDGPTIDDEPRHSSGIMRPRDEDGRPD